jgi:Na+/H+ antiporter NhaD/arsenite permease-like protein
MAAQAPDAETGRALRWAFALWACFSGNGTAIAASANAIAIGIGIGFGIAQRAGRPISFWRFTRHGILVTLLSTALAWVYVWLRYFGTAGLCHKRPAIHGRSHFGGVG